MDVQGIANFLDDLTGGIALLGLSILVGGLLWSAVVLHVRSDAERIGAAVLQRCIMLLCFGAWTLAAAQAVKLLAKATVLATTVGELPWAAYAATVQFQAGIARLVLAAGVAWAAARLSRRPSSRANWVLVIGLTVPLVASGAWLVHAVVRFEDRAPLMAITVVHQLAAAVWVGGVVQLLALARLRRSDAAAARFWPLAVTRFAALGIGAVC